MPLFGGGGGSSSRRTQSLSSEGLRRSAGRSLAVSSRSKSAPTGGRSGAAYRRVKGIMKFKSVEASLHSTYGDNSNNNGNGESKGEGENENGQSRRIQFKDIIVREYARTVGDNPSCSSGPPVTITWEYDPETKIISIDQYEELRPPRRTHFEMILPREVRQSMLRKEWDVTQTQIAAAVRANIKAKNQRRATINNLGKATKMEEMFESAGRKVKRGIFFKKSVSQQVQDLEEQMAVINCAKSTEELQEMMKDNYDGDNNGAVLDVDGENQDTGGFTEEMEDYEDADGQVQDQAIDRGENPQTPSSQPQHPPAIKIVEEESSDEEQEGEKRGQHPVANGDENRATANSAEVGGGGGNFGPGKANGIRQSSTATSVTMADSSGFASSDEQIPVTVAATDGASAGNGTKAAKATTAPPAGDLLEF